MLAGLTRRRLAIGLTGILLITGTLTTRMLLGARSEVQRAEMAHAHHDEDAELLHLRRALAYYIPGNPWTARALARMQTRAASLEHQGKTQLALHAYIELRGAVLQLRGIFSPYASQLPAINSRIARLMTLSASGSGNFTPAALEARLNHPDAPKPPWVAAALAGFVLWIGGSCMWLLGGGAVKRRGRTRTLLIAIAVLVNFMLFCIGLAFA